MPSKPQVHLFVKNSLVEPEAPQETLQQLLKQQEEALKQRQALELKELEQKHKEDIQALKKSQEKETDAPASSDSEELSANEYNMEDGWLVKDENVEATFLSLQEIKPTPSAVLKTIRVGTLMEAISFDDDDQAYGWFNCIVTSEYRKNKGVQICFVDETNQPNGPKEWTTRIKVRDDLVEIEENMLSEQLLIEQRHVDNLLDEITTFKKRIRTYKRKLKTEQLRSRKYKKKWIACEEENELEM